MSPNGPLALLVRKLNRHMPLDQRDQDALLALPHSVRELKAGAYIVREGDVPSHCATLLQGFAYRQKMLEDGARQILAVQIPGDALDLQHLYLDCADHNVQALSDVTLAMIPRLALHTLAAERPGIGRALSISIEVEASIAREWLVNLGRRDARKRIAHLLCEVAVRLEGQELVPQYGYELPMTQEQLGDAVGLTSVHVNRMLKKLETDGLITRSKRAISFPNWAVLQREAGFDPRYLHLRQQRAAFS